MSDEIRVRVVEFSDRAHYQLQWTCPMTGRKKTKSSGIERTGRKRERDEATKAASKWEEKLRAGGLPDNPRMTWEAFRERYEREVGARHARMTRKKDSSTFDLVERVMRPTRLSDITSTTVSAWICEIQKGRAPATVGSYARALQAALNWAKSVGLILKAPTFHIPRKQRGESLAKGRAICGEELDKIKAAVAKVVRARDVAAWQRMLDGLWWSGLRLGEALALSWEPTADVTAIVVDGSRPVVRFRAAGQKARRDEIWPCPPEFAEMLSAVPADERTGFVFNVPARGRQGGRATLDSAGRVISDFGVKAGVITGDDGKSHATAHTLRRAFGTRWSKRVMPPLLKRLMRHADISTTLKYYVDSDAAQIADELWEKFGNGNTFGNTTPAEATIS